MNISQQREDTISLLWALNETSEWTENKWIDDSQYYCIFRATSTDVI